LVEINGWMGIPDAFANMLFARAGWDSLTLDAQHGHFDEAAVLRTLQALSAPVPRRLVRVAANEAGGIGRMLDFGADGVIVPMVNSAEEARAVADACWYPPRGSRSFGPGLAALRAGDVPYLQAAAAIRVFAMIETADALAAVDGIAAVEGVTGLFVGPNDLAMAMGLPPGSDREEPAMLDAFGTILSAARRHGKEAGIYCATPAYARRMAAMGFAMVTAATDTVALALAGAACVAAMREAT
jgi:4-hydroxy-2-oxoheptanedioate aldolase